MKKIMLILEGEAETSHLKFNSSWIKSQQKAENIHLKINS